MAAKRPTMADIAHAAGVSTALVSIVFRNAPGASESTRAHVKKVADELGYIPDRRAQKLRQHRSGLIGVAFELQQAFHGDVVEKLYPAAARAGFDLQLSAVSRQRSEKDAVEALIRERCEAIILLGSRLTSAQLEELSTHVPVHVIARDSGSSKVGSVRVDDGMGARLALDHLLELGHQKIIYIDGGDAPGTAERSQVFHEHMSEFSGSVQILPGGSTEADGARVAAEIVDAWPEDLQEATTAIIAFNDRVAIGVLDILWQRGLAVPDDISVIGFDNSRLARLEHISLSTIAQDAETLANRAMEATVKQINSQTASATIIAPELIARRTTGPAPGQAPKR
ncbi:transcriptional regulator [Corynebacterium deserti GIMN1.010]|uniref:Transcriptional regulator n=1 Tax=Corynebacterium deserti GIMN1.010 TaxID=931089 RepID=A0A0M3Q9X1_9CORY|nr:LacI family DNA-binding transcriptional regulator [Corynebacterium deserti]ALC06293.1 transcriptional regulator [Corynebacterium deserti GIMN1.010]